MSDLFFMDFANSMGYMLEAIFGFFMGMLNGYVLILFCLSFVIFVTLVFRFISKTGKEAWQ